MSRYACFALWLVVLVVASPGAANERDATSGSYWLKVCTHHDENLQNMCAAYIGALIGMDEYLEYVEKKKLWCVKKRTPLLELKALFVAKLARAQEKQLSGPAVWFAVTAFKEAFPCK